MTKDKHIYHGTEQSFEAIEEVLTKANEKTGDDLQVALWTPPQNALLPRATLFAYPCGAVKSHCVNISSTTLRRPLAVP
ncbi:uncharacterized protein HfgLR_21790 (plasmid) [Haloferax gibbonsii]|uniref:Uncharacterized protein n=1 Tax=Haloferax gibbonsii TaxID=35746 RepID=A0A871BLK5_HALGI|nr:uncharacterized protein HfgLR_21790 [Haloferax gibbonsii]